MNSSIFKNKEIKLLILIPCRGTLVEGLVKWLKYAVPQAPFLVEWDTHHGRPEDDARNGMVQRFLADPKNYTHLMMIDDDIIPPPHALRMVLYNKPIVSAVVFTWKDGEPLGLLMKWDEKEKGYKQDTEAINKINTGETLVNIDASGTGCFIVKREVYENLVSNWFRYQYDEIGKVCLGEDFSFYRRAKEIGYSIWVDGTVFCGHIGSIDILEVQNLLTKRKALK